jgi:iron complex transport system substrate-binding protein
VFADITVADDSETMAVLAEPAGKIVRLSPHLTELPFSLGVGDRIKGTVDFFDYLEAAGFTSHLGLVVIEIHRLIM